MRRSRGTLHCLTLRCSRSLLPFVLPSAILSADSDDFIGPPANIFECSQRRSGLRNAPKYSVTFFLFRRPLSERELFVVVFLDKGFSDCAERRANCYELLCFRLATHRLERYYSFVGKTCKSQETYLPPKVYIVNRRLQSSLCEWRINVSVLPSFILVLC